MLRMAGELADGVLLNYLPASHIPWSVEQIRAGGPADVYAYVHAGVCDREEGIELARRDLFSYAVVDSYARSFERAGFADEVAAIREAHAAGDRDGALAAVSDRMVDAIDVMGDEDTVQATMPRLRRRRRGRARPHAPAVGRRPPRRRPTRPSAPPSGGPSRGARREGRARHRRRQRDRPGAVRALRGRGRPRGRRGRPRASASQAVADGLGDGRSGAGARTSAWRPRSSPRSRPPRPASARSTSSCATPASARCWASTPRRAVAAGVGRQRDGPRLRRPGRGARHGRRAARATSSPPRRRPGSSPRSATRPTASPSTPRWPWPSGSRSPTATPGIRVSCLCPQGVNTDLLRMAAPGRVRRGGHGPGHDRARRRRRRGDRGPGRRAVPDPPPPRGPRVRAAQGGRPRPLARRDAQAPAPRARRLG